MTGLSLRALVASLVLVLLAAGSVVAEGPGGPGREALLGELGRSRTALDPDTGTLRFVGGSSARPAASRARLGATANPRATARAFVTRYGGLFGIRDTARDVRISRETRAAGGGTFVRFEQLHGDVPVIAGELTIQVDDAGNVVSAIGETSAEMAVNTRPTLTASQATATARTLLSRNLGTGVALQTTAPELVIYDPALIGSPDPFGARLVWRTEVTNGRHGIDEYVLVDAASGAIALHFDQRAEVDPEPTKDRRICDGEGEDQHYPCSAGDGVWADADGDTEDNFDPPDPHADVVAAWNYSHDWWDFFYQRFGRDSVDDAGMTLVSTVNYCEFFDPGCVSTNAYWDGTQTLFYPGMASDDVVAHEFSHAFTQHTSGLVYIFQSGAINEALSDIFGEYVDLANVYPGELPADDWRMGEESVLGELRDMADPTSHGDPDRMQSPFYVTDSSLSDNGGVHTNSGVANKAAYLIAAGTGTFNGQTVDGIGLDKAAAIWYRVATEYLSSGSDYEDLGHALNQACTDLIGATIYDGTHTPLVVGIDADDCTEVSQAVLATQMLLQPTAPGAAAPEAPLCTSGTLGTELIDDDIADSTLGPDWTAGGPNPSRWLADDVFATSNPWHLWGQTPSPAGDAWLMRATATNNLPANAFLHFRHAHLFDSFGGRNYDGGIVEYQLDGGAWLDARPLFTHNGYNGTLYVGASGNVLANRQAFVDFSWGYVSSRISLTTLAGHDVGFRFRVTTDSSIAYDGWFIDDVRLYTCAGGTDDVLPAVGEPSANLRTNVAVGGTKPIKLNVGFFAADESGLNTTELQRRPGTGTYKVVSLGSPTGTNVNLAYKANTTAKPQFRARATDTNANQSAWLTAEPFRVLAFQNGSASVVKTGTWKNRGSSKHYGGSAQSSSTLNARQRLTATVTDFAIVSTTGRNRGKFKVFVDNVEVATIDLYSPTLKYRQVVYAVDFGVAGTHKIEIVVLHQKNPSSTAFRVDFDAFLALAP